jgi:CheY-like chemotaxis protein
MYLQPQHLPKASILVLEEDPLLRAGLCRLLTGAGYSLAESAIGADPTGRIDLVLAGIDARRVPNAALQLLDRSAPVVLLVDHAAWSGLDFLDAANAFGAVAVLLRPFSRAALLSVVTKTLSQPTRDAVESARAELPTLGELLVCLDNPNFV